MTGKLLLNTVNLRAERAKYGTVERPTTYNNLKGNVC